MELIQSTTVVGTATTTVTFTDIPQDGTHLYCVASTRFNGATGGAVSVGPIGDLYSLNFVASAGRTNFSATNSTSPAGFFGSGIALFTGYTRTFTKNGLSETTEPVNNLSEKRGFTSDSDGVAMTSVTFNIGGAALAPGSTFAIYKITAGTGGATFS